MSGNGYRMELQTGRLQVRTDDITQQEYVLLDSTFSARATLNGALQ